MDPNGARQRLEAEWQRVAEARSAIEHERLTSETQDESTGELSPIDQHQADNASDMFEREKDFGIRDQIDVEERALKDAFDRLARGVYGRCETCGAEISDERLAAVPTTRFCVEHELEWEVHWAPASFGSAEHLAEYEAIQHFDFLPDDDELEPVVEESAEEAAVHSQPSSR